MNLVENNWRVGSFFYTIRLRRCHSGSHLPKKFFSYFSSGIVLHSDQKCDKDYDLGSDQKCDQKCDKDYDLGSDQKCDQKCDSASDSNQKCNSDKKCDSASTSDKGCTLNIEKTPNTLSIWGLFISWSVKPRGLARGYKRAIWVSMLNYI